MKAATLKERKFEKEALIHLDVIFSAALKMTGNRMEAEDLVQETFLRAFKFFDKFKPGTNCRAWLFKIMTNLYINRYNRRKSRPSSSSYDEIEEVYTGEKLNPTEYIGNSEYDINRIYMNLLDDDIRNLLQELPEDFRITIVLCDIQGFSYEEAARITEVKIGTVKSRLFRARRKLQKGLYEWARSNGYLPKEILHGAA
jgi:RNA polymerase sigma-70 factor (ECF subfamily)